MTRLITERDIVTKILKKYKKSPCLWDPSNKFYFNKQVRQECYESMVDLWQQLEPDGTVSTLKKKLEHFRAAYRRELKKVTNSMASSTNPENIHKPTLWYYNLLTFLNLRHDQSKLSSDEEDVCEEYVHEPLKKKRRISSVEEPSESTKPETTQDTIPTSSTKPSEDDDKDYVNNYGLTIAKQLKELDDHVRYEAERIISDVIYRARTGTLPKYSPQAMEFIIPQSGPSWYDVPVEQPPPTECLVVTVTDPSDGFIKSELEDTVEYPTNLD